MSLGCPPNGVSTGISTPVPMAPSSDLCWRSEQLHHHHPRSHGNDDSTARLRTRGAEWHWVWSRYLHVLSSAQSPNLGNKICFKNIHDAIRMFYAEQKTMAGIVSMLVQIIMQYHLEVCEVWQLSAQPPGGTGGYWAEPRRLWVSNFGKVTDSGLVMIIRIVIGMINIAESRTELLNWKKHIFTMQTQVSTTKSMLKTSHKPILT